MEKRKGERGESMQGVAVNKKRNSKGKLSGGRECVRSPNQELPIIGNPKSTI